jgi:hypothetical protein
LGDRDSGRKDLGDVVGDAGLALPLANLALGTRRRRWPSRLHSIAKGLGLDHATYDIPGQ